MTDTSGVQRLRKVREEEVSLPWWATDSTSTSISAFCWMYRVSAFFSMSPVNRKEASSKSRRMTSEQL
jgi:hypothetical protein